MAGPILGQTGTVTFTSGYVANVKSWTLNIVADEHDITDFASTDDWHEYMSGLRSWSGSYDCLLDDTTPAVVPGFGAAGAGTALVLTSSTGRTFTGTAISTADDISVSPLEPNRITVRFRGTGALVAA